MHITEVQALNTEQKEQLMHLWNTEYPQQLNYKNIEGLDAYLSGLDKASHYLIVDNSNKMYGWGVSFTRSNEIWFAIIVAEVLHRKGWGTSLLNAIKQNNKILNGWVIEHNNYVKSNGSIYQSPMSFYQKNNFIPKEDQLETATFVAKKITWEAK